MIACSLEGSNKENQTGPWSGRVNTIHLQDDRQSGGCAVVGSRKMSIYRDRGCTGVGARTKMKTCAKRALQG